MGYTLWENAYGQDLAKSKKLLVKNLFHPTAGHPSHWGLPFLEPVYVQTFMQVCMCCDEFGCKGRLPKQVFYFALCKAVGLGVWGFRLIRRGGR